MSSYAPSEWEQTSVISDFEPIPPLNLSNADVHLLFLTNNAAYTAPSDDLLFATVTEPSTEGFYRSLDTVVVLACAEQYQFCTPSQLASNGCLDAAGIFAAGQSPIAYRESFSLTSAQAAAVARLYLTAERLDFASIIEYLEASSMVAVTSLQMNDFNWNGRGKSAPFFASAPLPSDQWKTEVKHWFEIILASMQLATVRYATGPANHAYDVYVSPPEQLPRSHDLDDANPNDYIPALRAMCNQQRLPFTNSTSFSVVGLVVTLVIGVILTHRLRADH